MGEIVGNLVMCLYVGGAYGIGYLSMRYGSKDLYTAIITGLSWPLVAIIFLFVFGFILLVLVPLLVFVASIFLLMSVVDTVSWVLVRWRLWKLSRA